MTSMGSTTATTGRSMLQNNVGILPQKPTTREIVREEIRRQKMLDKLEEQYKNGEISKFEYSVQKAMLNMLNTPQPELILKNCVA